MKPAQPAARKDPGGLYAVGPKLPTSPPLVDATLVTVHGFWSNPATWNRLCAVWEADDELEGLQVHGFSYSSPKKLRLPLSWTRVPDFDDIAQTLATEYVTVLGDASNIAFVTHSQGGLVLQQFLAWMISEGRARELARIRTVVMLACPNGGSQYLDSIRRALGYGRHPQAGDLEVLSKRVAETQRAVLDRIVYASGVDDHRCRIPFHVYAAGSDAIVPAASAKAAFPGAGTLAGNHFTILDPSAPGNRTAAVVKRHILTDLAERPSVSAHGAELAAHVPLEDPAALDRLLGRPRWTGTDETASVLAAPEAKALEPRYDQSPRYRHPQDADPGIIEHRVGVFNPPGQPERRVRVILHGMDPYPRNIPEPRYRPVIPYVVPLLSGGDAYAGLAIRPGQEELWGIGYTGTGSDGNMNAGGFAVPDQRWRGLPWRFDPDERWRLFYRIECDGMADVRFSVVVSAENGQIRCDLLG